MEQVSIGVVGCGNISDVYLNALKQFEMLRISACADLLPERAREKAEKHAISKACSVEELIADTEIDIVLNLTVPKAHAEVAMAALNSGKHVYNEKPIALTRQGASELLETAEEKGLRIGCAPDTFLGAALQTCRKVVEDGTIGEPIAATAVMMTHGPEDWHPDPEFLYQAGAGPLFDMGPYYLTALCNLIGPVKSVTGMAQTTFPERTIGSGPKQGETFKVKVPTHVVAVLQHANGAITNMVTSFDVWEHYNPYIVLHGTLGTMEVPDANMFDGTVRVRDHGSDELTDMPLTHGYTDNCRGLGVADMGYAIRSSRPHRASGEMAYHVLDVMHAIFEAADSRAHVELASTCVRPEPLPIGLRQGVLD
jgi:predicted dehydrogenase